MKKKHHTETKIKFALPTSNPFFHSTELGAQKFTGEKLKSVQGDRVY
jgi:hypothetical protein